ncbi:MAG: hypothetical protein AAF957_18780 [Planctomycetota bacterium]
MFGRATKDQALIREREQSDRNTEALVSEIGAQREAQRDLLERFEEEARVATNAVKAASLAREERDEYRRVLAAAIANERRQAEQVEALETRRRELEDHALQVVRDTGKAEAERDGLRDRLTALEDQLGSQATRHEQERADAADRAWAEREAARSEVVQLVTRSREEAAVLADEVRSALKKLEEQAEGPPPPDDPSASARRLRGRLLVALAIGAMLVGVALTPAAFLSAIDAERAAFVHLASGASPWQLIIATVLCFAAAVFLLGGARRDLGAPATD